MIRRRYLFMAPGTRRARRRHLAVEDPDQLLAPSRVWKTLGICPRTFYRHAEAGKIPVVRIGRLLKVRAADLTHIVRGGVR
jgi:hypothetical protein